MKNPNEMNEMFYGRLKLKIDRNDGLSSSVIPVNSFVCFLLCGLVALYNDQRGDGSRDGEETSVVISPKTV